MGSQLKQQVSILLNLGRLATVVWQYIPYFQGFSAISSGAGSFRETCVEPSLAAASRVETSAVGAPVVGYLVTKSSVETSVRTSAVGTTIMG